MSFREAKIRLLCAGALAPVGGIFALACVLVLSRVAGGERSLSEAATSIGSTWSLLALFGLPLAYVIEVGVGVPAYAVLEARGRFQIAHVIVVGAAAGAIAFGIPLAMVGVLSLSTIPGIVALGAIGGSVAGALFWGIAFAGIRANRAT